MPTMLFCVALSKGKILILHNACVHNIVIIYISSKRFLYILNNH